MVVVVAANGGGGGGGGAGAEGLVELSAGARSGQERRRAGGFEMGLTRLPPVDQEAYGWAPGGQLTRGRAW